MKDAKYGRLEINCPICGSLKQVKIDDVDPALVFGCNGCHEKFRVRFALPVLEADVAVVDDTPTEKIAELAEKTVTRVTPKSMSKRIKTTKREKK